ncbi:hypothetical protein BDV38DRAFT_278572 [Aspergillus pseudotamarii]|uniref:C2H2-type domain-containing protein n=1 Tax=Aspergillus pseudotamarii TaxID=132259 RepID=A0A5N6T6B1_ASPPS|nr:uncharacterized protein BDV38DRAFT_278572 [Aspergillus pseudotamarii]KAE8141789.1 hypothetical protein BDV38DRAFT_278572 [Aspergillus pseudotamarii]
MQNDFDFLAGDSNMKGLPPKSTVMPGSPVHYPQWQLDVPLHEGSIVHRPSVNYDLEVGPHLCMLTSFHSDQIATAGYSYGHLSSNTTLTPPTLPVEPQSINAQQETRAKDVKESGKNHRLAQRCKWEGCTSTKSFNREADLLRHVRTIHIAPRSYRCNVDGCLKSFNRSDNLKGHMLRVHDCDC